MVHEFTVRDMTCSGCVASVKTALSRVPGVTAVGTEAARKYVRVEADAEVGQETLITAITNAGYSNVAAASNEPSNAERWSANALEITSSSTSSGCGCCN